MRFDDGRFFDFSDQRSIQSNSLAHQAGVSANTTLKRPAGPTVCVIGHVGTARHVVVRTRFGGEYLVAIDDQTMGDNGKWSALKDSNEALIR